jgi:GTP cyclohydrolase FolE2
MKKITIANYKQDKFYEKVVRAMAAVLERQEFVSPIDVMLQVQRLTPKQVEDWR